MIIIVYLSLAPKTLMQTKKKKGWIPLGVKKKKKKNLQFSL